MTTFARWLAGTAFLLAAPLPLHAQSTVLLVRHAEQLADGSADPALSSEGVTRATRLAEVLRDAGVKAIYTSERLRARETAAPLTRKLGIEAVIVPAAEPKTLVARIKKDHPNGVVVIVGHTNTLPEILKLLGRSEPILIPETEYDNLFVVVPAKRGAPTVARLRY